MQAASTHQQESHSEVDEAKFRSRRMTAITLINFSFFFGYLIDQRILPGGNTGIMLSAAVAVLVAIRLYLAESARHSR
jgi:hypothetical protein